ncbi:MAG: alpha/beta fold hydrolase [Gemmatimonadota bacterium]|nr:alpha/beta fold hydrolase [Gemmatimonadota bacterium]
MRFSGSIRAATALLMVVGLTWPSPASGQNARQGLLTLDDARLFYEVRGSGEPMIVVHGGPGLDHRYLRPGLDILATRNTLIYYDQRGTGRSTTDVGPETVTLEAFVGDIEALRQALGHERIHVLTHSFGSIIGLAYARAYPDRLRSLVLMNPVEPGDRFSAETSRRRAAARTESDSAELATLTTSEGFAAHDPATLEQVFQVAFRAAMRDPDRVEELDLELMDATARNGQEIAELLGGEVRREEPWDWLEEIETPTLVVHGEDDAPPIEMSAELADQLPAGRLEVLASGHFPYIEAPDDLLAAVSAFLAGLQPR